jgi:hypothetical protein
MNRSVDTICLGCCFAQGQSKDGLFEQKHNGCSLRILDKLRKLDANIEYVYDENDNQFHVIYGRLCPFHRPNRWLQKDESVDESHKRVRKEIKLQPDVVIYCNEETSIDDLSATLDSLQNGSNKPVCIYVINHMTKIKPSEFIALMKRYPFQWRLESILEECDTNRTLDIVTKKCKGIFVSYFRAGFHVPQEFFTNIDEVLHTQLQRIILLEPIDDINGLFVLRIFYQQAGGNKNTNIIEKAKHISKEQECPNLVQPVTQLVPQLLQ